MQKKLQAELESLKLALANVPKGSEQYGLIQKRIAAVSKEVENTEKKNKSAFRSMRDAAKGFFNEIAEGNGGVRDFLLTGVGIGALAEGGVKLLEFGFGLAKDAIMEWLFPANRAIELTAELSTEIAKEKAALDSYFPVLQDTNASQLDRAMALEQLNEAYKDLLPNINLEKVAISELPAIYEQLNNAITANVIVKAKAAEQERLNAELITKTVEAVRAQRDLNNALNKQSITSNELITAQTFGLSKLSDKLIDAGIDFTYFLKNWGAQSELEDVQNQMSELDAVFDEVSATLGDFGAGQATVNSELNRTKEQLKVLNQLSGLYAKFNIDISGKVAEVAKREQGLSILRKKEIKEYTEKEKAERKARSEEAKRNAEQRVAANSLTELEQALEKVNRAMKQYTDLADKPQLEKLAAQHKDLSTKIAAARKELEAMTALANPYQTLEARVKSAKDAIVQQEIATLTAQTAQQERANAMIAATTTEVDLARAQVIVEREKLQIEKDAAAIALQLRLDLLQAERELLNAKGESTLALDKEIATLKLQRVEQAATTKTINDSIAEQINLREIATKRELNALESKRNTALAAAKDEATAAEINAKFDEQRAGIERKNAIDVTTLRIKQKGVELDLAAARGESTTALENELETLNLELTELGRKDVTPKINTNKIKDAILEIVDGVNALSSEVFGLLSNQAQTQVSELASAVERQKSALDELLANTETANVERVRLEKERLDSLLVEQEKAKNKELIITQAQIAAQAALTISRAAAEGGGLASAFTIAAAVAAMVAGFAAARSASEQAFFDGTTYVTRKANEPVGRDTIKARLHEGEAVIPTATNAAYKESVRAIYNKSVPAPALNAFVRNYKNHVAAVAQSATDAFVVHNQTDMSKTEQLLAALVRNTQTQPTQPVPATKTVTSGFNERGLIHVVETATAKAARVAASMRAK